jgi:hypothetical protein
MLVFNQSQRYLKTQYDMSVSVLKYRYIICRKGSSRNGNNDVCVVNLVEAEDLISCLIQGMFSCDCSKGLS